MAWLETDEEAHMLFSRIRKSYPALSVQLRVYFLVTEKLIALNR